MPERFRRSVPWRLGDLYVSAGLVALGTVLIGVASFGADKKSSLSDGIPWVNLGVGGVIVIGTGAVLWVLAGMRTTGQLRRLVLADVRAVADTADAVMATRPSSNGSGDATFVTGRGMTRYHRPTCLLVAGKAVERVATPPGDLRPCDICLSGRQ